MLILAISHNLDELLEDRGLTAMALCRKLRGIVVMAVNLAIVLIIRILGAKDRRANAARKMLNVVFPVQGSNVGSAQSSPARVT